MMAVFGLGPQEILLLLGGLVCLGVVVGGIVVALLLSGGKSDRKEE